MTRAIPLAVDEPPRLSPAAAGVLAHMIRSASDLEQRSRTLVDEDPSASPVIELSGVASSSASQRAVNCVLHELSTAPYLRRLVPSARRGTARFRHERVPTSCRHVVAASDLNPRPLPPSVPIDRHAGHDSSGPRAKAQVNDLGHRDLVVGAGFEPATIRVMSPNSCRSVPTPDVTARPH
jgi:hypothetical protein